MGHILLVEANAGMRDWCRMHLSTAGHEVSPVDDAQRAMRLVQTRIPELVVIATDLEGNTGYALAATLRADARTAAVPVLFLAPEEHTQAIAQASALAPGNVLTKPLSRDALLSAVAQRLRPSPSAVPIGMVATQAAPAPSHTPPAMLSMEAKTVSLLVVTLRNLVSLARSLRGKSLDALVRRFLELARDAVVSQGGWVVKLDAAGLTAVFENTPNDRRNHASLAVEAALHVVLAARRAKRWAEAALHEPSLPSLSIGCGVHSGEVIVARLPLDGRITPSLAGVTVDIAYRLNGRAKGLGWSVAVSEAAALLSGSRFEFWRRATLTDTDHDLTLSILECGGFNPGGVMPEDLALMGEVREAVEANTVIAQLPGDVDPRTADQTIVVRGAHPVETLPELPERRIVRRLGQGSHVTTYLAVHVPTGREEAIKTLSMDQPSTAFVQHYLDVYLRMKGQQRRELVAVREIGHTADVVFVATELLPGPGVDEVIRKRLAVGDGLNLLAQICRALEALHSLKLTHGALRAEHFLFRDDSTIVLADFNASGRAAAFPQQEELADEEESGLHEVDQQAGVRSDLRSAGLILLSMLSSGAGAVERALAGNVDNLEQASRLPMQLSSLQPLLDGLLGLAGRKPYATAAEALAELGGIEGLWSRPVFPQE